MTIAKYIENYDSGLAWLGAVPKHWSLKRLGHFFSERREKVSDKDFQPLSVTKHGIVPRLETAAKTQDGDNRKRVIAGDFVINSRSDRKGSSGLSELDGSVSLICIVLEPNGVYGRFAHHLLRSEVFQEEFYRNGKGIVADLWSTGFSEMKNIVIPVPSHHEQTQIARFLDHETAKIDALIREQERLIELLQEKRQAVISHAVTKGLDPDVPMKDSGVEWLGEVPAHWRVGKLRWYATIQGGVAKGKDYQDQKTVSLPYLRVANVQAGYVDLTEVKEIAVLESEIERYSLRHGDVLMNEGGDNDKLGRGTVWRAEIEPCLHQNHVFAIRPNGHLTPEWLAMFTQSSRARSYFFLNSKQSTNLASISSSNVMNLDLPMPSVDEQERILQFLESELQQFTDLQKQADKGIQLLLERRSALISAAVTGKIDVRNWQPPVDESAFDEDVRQAGMEVTA
ncbi:restriction endonuclease subunit S [Marinobacter goseongensis]|uniref:restriction endonuclease subunit S n=1 Tax=Marinobacter goseongensis TaxID=453838 RepID=UPI0020051A1C|nr:restriction endonuclease subunit S [Marinobacter goseongensis]